VNRVSVVSHEGKLSSGGYAAAVAGYSGTPLPRKLGIKAGHTVTFPRAPKGFARTLGPLPDGVRVKQRATGPVDVIVAFIDSRADLERRFRAFATALAPDGGLWIAWPKRASGVATDMTEDVAREVALEHGLVDNKICAIDDVWSGLRLVYRLEDRPPR
jgi:hypothetical protein